MGKNRPFDIQDNYEVPRSENLINVENAKKDKKHVPPPVPPKPPKLQLPVSPNIENASDPKNEKNDNNKLKVQETYIKNQASQKTTNNIIQRNREAKKRRMTDAEAREKLLQVATPGDPNDKYILKDRLGSGFVEFS